MIPELPFTVTDWETVAPSLYPGASGEASWRTQTFGNVRVRIVRYSPGYVADHWCKHGHVLYVISGELVTELDDGRRFTLTSGMSYQVSNAGDASHRSVSEPGATLFIVDEMPDSKTPSLDRFADTRSVAALDVHRPLHGEKNFGSKHEGG